MGRGMSRPLQRNVCFRVVGCREPGAVLGARPPRREAALLQLSHRWSAALCFRAEVAAVEPASRSRTRSPGDRGVLRIRLYTRSAFDLLRRPQACAGALSCGSPRRAATRTEPVLGPAVYRRRVGAAE